MLITGDKQGSEDVMMWFREAPKSLQVYSLNLSYLDIEFSWEISLQLDSCENKFFSFQYSASCKWWKHEAEKQK